jgi:hypothetical protein
MRSEQNARFCLSRIDSDYLSDQCGSADFLTDSLLDMKFMEHIWPSFESLQKRRRICAADAKPEARRITEIGPSFMRLKADQTNGYIVGARQRFTRLISGVVVRYLSR